MRREKRGSRSKKSKTVAIDVLSPKRLIRNTHGVLHKALKNAVKEDMLKENVCARVTLPRLEADERQPLTQEQAKRLIQAAKGSKLEALLIVALTTGLRHGELRALRWSAVNLDKGELYVRRSVLNLQGYGTVESGMILEIYGHVLPGMQQEAMQKWGECIE